MVKNLRKLRNEYKISQKQLADVIGVSQQSINKYENHNIEPDIETLKSIANYFNTSVDYLIGYINENKTDNKHHELLRIFDQMTEQQQKLFIEQGKVFVKANDKNF